MEDQVESTTKTISESMGVRGAGCGVRGAGCGVIPYLLLLKV